jgi:hypothetical protein
MAPPEQPYHARTFRTVPVSRRVASTPIWPTTRTPPELKEIARGYHSRGSHAPSIPLAKAREMQPPTLTPSSLFEEQARIDSLRLEVYNRILGTVHQKIRSASTLPSSPQMTYFDVPEWQPGCPRFDVKDCILYMVWQLRHSGFRVMYISPNRLIISWKEQSIQYYSEESPIRQAMVAASTASKTTGGTTTSSVPPPPGERKKKTPSTYRPPSDTVAGMLATGGAKRAGGASTITFI